MHTLLKPKFCLLRFPLSSSSRQQGSKKKRKPKTHTHTHTTEGNWRKPQRLELSADVRTLSVKVESVSSTTSPFTATKQAADMTRNAKIDIPLMFAISCSFSDGRVLLRDRNLQTNVRVGSLVSWASLSLDFTASVVPIRVFFFFPGG